MTLVKEAAIGNGCRLFHVTVKKLSIKTLYFVILVAYICKVFFKKVLVFGCLRAYVLGSNFATIVFT